ncbi:MAG: NAD(P)H-dependent oxidoreductase [Cytophagales bacterium]|nr:MAG: NAD(P)H-dependent oxidoreductase [Cytophagales bacterium]
MTILAISGSLRVGSTNTLLIQAVADRLPDTARLTLFDGLDALPHFSPERDTDPPLTPVAHLRESIEQADAVLICTPEYAFGIPGVLKNALDWLVSTTLMTHKPVAALSASPSYAGGERAMASLLPTLQALDVTLAEGGVLVVSSVRSKMAPDGTITDEATDADLRSLVQGVLRAVKAT